MRTDRFVLGALVGLAAVSVLRQRREAAGVREGRLPALGPDGALPPGVGPAPAVHRRLAATPPPRPRTATCRALAGCWSAPVTALGVVAALAGGVVPRWDATHGCLVAHDVGGPARWFLHGQGAAAATIGQLVLVAAPTAGERLLAHEAAHVRQQERWGPVFAVAYGLAQVVWGYRANPFEVAARRVAGELSGPAGPA